MRTTKHLLLATTCLFTLTACLGGGSSSSGNNDDDNSIVDGDGGADRNGAVDDDGGLRGLPRAEAITFAGTFEGGTDWGSIDSTADDHVIAADMAFLVREMEPTNMTVGREFLSGNLQNSMDITGDCGGTFQTSIPDGGTTTASAGSGTFDDFCFNVDLSGSAIDPFVLASGSATWDIALEVTSLRGHHELSDVVLQWRGEEFTINTRMEYEGADRYYVTDVTLNDTTYRFYGVFEPQTDPDVPGDVSWAGVHPDFGKFRILQDIFDSDDQIFSYPRSASDCLGPITGAQTMTEPEQGAEFQFRANDDCRTYSLNGEDSNGVTIDSDDHEWLAAIIEDSVD